MKAIVYDAPRQFTYREIETPKRQAEEIFLRVDAYGLCGTDLHVHHEVPLQDYDKALDLAWAWQGIKNGIIP